MARGSGWEPPDIPPRRQEVELARIWLWGKLILGIVVMVGIVVAGAVAIAWVDASPSKGRPPSGRPASRQVSPAPSPTPSPRIEVLPPPLASLSHAVGGTGRSAAASPVASATATISVGSIVRVTVTARIGEHVELLVRAQDPGARYLRPGPCVPNGAGGYDCAIVALDDGEPAGTLYEVVAVVVAEPGTALAGVASALADAVRAYVTGPVVRAIQLAALERR